MTHAPLAGPVTVQGTSIVSSQFVIALWALTITALVLTGYLTWRARGRGVLRWVLRIMVNGALVLVCVADTVNAHYSYWPTLGDASHGITGDRQWLPITALDRLSPSDEHRAESRGLIIRVPLPADPAHGFGVTDNVAYLPPQYFTDPTARFPVVYLFHGSPGRPADWFHGGRAAQEGHAVAAAGRPAIVFAAQMSRSWTDDPECVDGVHELVESHLLQQVIPSVDSHLRTRPDREDRVFAGMSAGGYCALNLGLRHRDLVSTVIDMSGDTVPTHTGGAGVLFGSGGPQIPELIAANSPARYAAKLSASPAMRIWLDCGTGDHAVLAQLTPLAAQLRADGFAVSWHTRPGGHTYRVWTAALHEALPWSLGLPAAESHGRA